MIHAPAPFARALAGVALPDWLDCKVEIRRRRKTPGLIIEPNLVTIAAPPAATPQELAEALAGQLRMVLTAASVPGPSTPGWYDHFDLIVIHTSGGKDSQTMLRRALALLPASVRDRIVVLHLVLDKDPQAGEEPRIEWQQVPELAAEQAARSGIGLAAGDGWAVWNLHRAKKKLTGRSQWAGQMHYARRDFDGDLLDDFATRCKRDGSPRGWATIWTRYCTSDWKTAVGRAFTEYICAQIRAELGLTRPVRVLQIMGFRAEESDDRRDRAPFSFSFKASASASRHVWEWLPIHDMTKPEVWADIAASGVPYHPAYDEGLSRLSCRVCIQGSRRDLALVARMAPDTVADYVQVETDLNDPFQHRRPLASIQPAPGPAGFDVHWLSCPTCAVRVLANTRESQRYCPAHASTGPWHLPALSGPAAPCAQGTLFDLIGPVA
ncbi:phosphoadenosine phosphosulfate reductase family protein [Polymorphospora sp. NPDC050346]|uniref:phosphoadenosine phosphosulfate reductase domain-containing protein n=1 Tax=Polymorphospora sp. NPDC050346 TaxID=3155780 RepID=UPI0033C9204A